MPDSVYQKYQDYFKNQYGATFSIGDTATQLKFLFNQLALADRIIGLAKYQDKKILEIGSGLGALAKLLLDRGCRDYQGLEMDKEIVNFTKQTIGDYFQNSSLQDFAACSTEKFDLILAFEVLEHLDDPLSAIAQIKSLLNANGVFVGTSPFPFRKNVLADKTHLFVLHPLTWQKLFQQAGFSRVETYPMSFLPYIWRINKHFNIRLPFYLPFKYFISTTLIIAYA